DDWACGGQSGCHGPEKNGLNSKSGIAFMLRHRAAILFYFVPILLGPATVRADDNPFGLPAPIDKNRPGAVMLHGGGRHFSGEVRQEFVRLAGGKDARIVLMPSDSYQLGRDEDGEPLAGGETAAAYERRMAAEYDRWVALRKNGRVADFQFLYRDRES